MTQGYGHPNTYQPPGGHYGQHHDSSAQGKGHSTMGAAAGGLAVGAVGGALVGHALGMKLHHLLISSAALMEL